MDQYPDLSFEEKTLVRTWRAIISEDANVEVSVHDSKPDVLRIYYDNLVSYLEEPPEYELLPVEIQVLELIRSIGYGKVHLIVKNGVPFWLNGDTYKQVKLSEAKKKMAIDIEDGKA